MEPIRCFTCNAVLRFKSYEEALHAGTSAKQFFEESHIPRFCCRRMYLSHPKQLEEHLRSFPLRDTTTPEYSLRFEVTRTVEVRTD